MTPLRYAAAGLLALLLVFGLAQSARLQRAETAIQAERAGRAQDKAAAAMAAASAVMAARAEEQRRTAALLENVHAAQQESARARRELAAADAAAGGLRRDFRAAAAAAARCRSPASDPSIAAGGAPATGAADLLADVFDELEAAGRAVAAEADRRRTAGLTCERANDSLTTP